LYHEDADSLSARDMAEPIGHIHAGSILPTDDKSQLDSEATPSLATISISEWFGKQANHSMPSALKGFATVWSPVIIISS
jgi:hypothetical protein